MISLDLLLLLLIVGAIYFVIGALWYSPVLFGKMWMKAVGITTGESDPEHNMTKSMVISYVVCVAQVFVITMVISHLKVQMIIYSAVIGAMIALAFGLLSAVRSHAFAKRNMTQMAIDHGYDIVGSALSAAIITWWLAIEV